MTFSFFLIEGKKTMLDRPGITRKLANLHESSEFHIIYSAYYHYLWVLFGDSDNYLDSKQCIASKSDARRQASFVEGINTAR